MNQDVERYDENIRNLQSRIDLYAIEIQDKDLMIQEEKRQG